jgi:hypothetical protein
VLLADCICPSAIQPFNLIAICSLQWAEYSDVIGLELMGGVGGNTAKDGVVLEIIPHDFERLVRPEAVINQSPRLLIRPLFRLGIKHELDPVQADLGIGISRLGACKMPSRGRVRGPCASMGCRWRDDQWIERPTVSRNALDRGHHCPLNTCVSISS